MTKVGVDVKHALYTQSLEMKQPGMYRMPP